MSTSPSLDIYSVVATIESNAISIPLTLEHNMKDTIVEEEALIERNLYRPKLCKETPA